MAQAVNGDAMPLGNETGMTDDERQKLGAWLAEPVDRPTSHCEARRRDMAELSDLHLDAVNRMSEDEFVAAFGDIAEHSPWVAAERRRSAALRASRDGHDRRLPRGGRGGRPASASSALLLRASRPRRAGRRSPASSPTIRGASRRGAGLDRLTRGGVRALHRAEPTTIARRFGIPFIFAVRGATKHDILDALRARGSTIRPRSSSPRRSARSARIIRFRLEDRVAP